MKNKLEKYLNEQHQYIPEGVDIDLKNKTVKVNLNHEDSVDTCSKYYEQKCP